MDEAIRSLMQQEIAKGTSLDDVQTLVNRKFGTKYTFMEIRIMASELAVDWGGEEEVGKTPEKSPVAAEQPQAAEKTAAEVPGAETDAQAPAAGGTVVEINKINPPGVMMSGSVKFASGASGEWVIDNYGRCGFSKVEGKPTEEDLRAFQLELQKKLG